jgi:hypothetical protein
VLIFHLFRSSYSHSFERTWNCQTFYGGTCQLEEAGFENPKLRLQPDQTVLKLRISRSWKESRQESRAEINSFENEDPKPVPNHLLKKDQFVDDLFIIYQINQEPGSVVRLRTDRTRIFKSIFSCQIKVMKFLNFVSNIRRHWNRTRLIRIITDQVQVQVQVHVFGITNK